MTETCKVWLWLLTIFYGIMAIYNLVMLITHGGLGANLSTGQWCAQLIFLLGILILQFAKRRVGFFLMCLVSTAMYILDVFVLHDNIFLSMVMAVAAPLITWYFLKTGHVWENLN